MLTQNNVTVHEDMRIPMRDGITLSARVWMPAAQDAPPLPAILEILPYRKRDGTTERDATTHAHFAQHDYVCLRVDLRGTGESEGLFDDEYSEQELSDVEDTIAWIAQQNWCTGAVGIMGISWGGFNGLQVAARNPPALKAVISICSSVDRYADDIHYKGGCQLTENIGWAATVMSWFAMPPDPALVGDDWRDIWHHRMENTPFLISDWLTHSSRDAYWEHGSICEDFSQIKTPVLNIGGWHDGYRNTADKLLSGGTSGPVKAIMGPWNHKYPHIAAPRPQVDFIAEALQWWDRWLKGTPNAVDTMCDYRVYVMDGIAPQCNYDHRPGRWLGFDQWPAPQIATTSFQLGQNSLGDGAMSAPISVDTDLTCGRKFGEYFPFGFGPGELPDDQREEDALSACFDTPPLTDALTVLGAANVQVSLSCSAPYGQFVARLCDVGPDGASTLISYGVLNLQFRDGFAQACPLVVDDIYQINLSLDQAAYVVPKGHKIRLAISPSYWPFIWPERGAVTLTVSQGALHLPTLTDDTGLGIDMPEPTQMNAAITKTTRSDREFKSLTTDNKTDILTIIGDHGEVAFLDHGLRVSSAVKEIWSINHSDVNSAHAYIEWDRGLIRDDVTVSTNVTMTMRCDADAYYVSAHLRAYEQKACVFERQFKDRIQRD